jgi:hypothetical protein
MYFPFFVFLCGSLKTRFDGADIALRTSPLFAIHVIGARNRVQRSYPPWRRREAVDGSAEQDHESAKHAIPAEALPAQSSRPGADGTLGEVAGHVNHVQTAARLRKQTINPRLV